VGLVVVLPITYYTFSTMSNNTDPFDDSDFKRLQLFVYLLPVFGLVPALWTLNRGGSRQQKSISRLAVTLAAGWIISYVLLAVGAETTQSLSVPLLLTSSLLTSGYFIVNIWLMIRLWQRKSIKLPVISKLSDRLP